MLLEHMSSVITKIIFIDNCVFCFSILVTVGSQNCSFGWYTSKYEIAHNPMLYYWHLYFLLVPPFLAEYTWHKLSLHCINQCLLYLESRFLVGSWMGLVLFVSQYEVKATFLNCVLGHLSMSVWIVSVIISTRRGKKDKFVENGKFQKMEEWILCPSSGVSANRIRSGQIQPHIPWVY